MILIFEEITKNIEEGTNFYNDITKLLINLQNKINDFCFARYLIFYKIFLLNILIYFFFIFLLSFFRKTEREELVEYLSKSGNVSSTNTSSSSSSATTASTTANKITPASVLSQSTPTPTTQQQQPSVQNLPFFQPQSNPYPGQPAGYATPYQMYYPPQPYSNLPYYMPGN